MAEPLTFESLSKRAAALGFTIQRVNGKYVIREPGSQSPPFDSLSIVDNKLQFYERRPSVAATPTPVPGTQAPPATPTPMQLGQNGVSDVDDIRDDIRERLRKYIRMSTRDWSRPDGLSPNDEQVEALFSDFEDTIKNTFGEVKPKELIELSKVIFPITDDGERLLSYISFDDELKRFISRKHTLRNDEVFDPQTAFVDFGAESQVPVDSLKYELILAADPGALWKSRINEASGLLPGVKWGLRQRATEVLKNWSTKMPHLTMDEYIDTIWPTVDLETGDIGAFDVDEETRSAQWYRIRNAIVRELNLTGAYPDKPSANYLKEINDQTNLAVGEYEGIVVDAEEEGITVPDIESVVSGIVDNFPTEEAITEKLLTASAREAQRQGEFLQLADELGKLPEGASDSQRARVQIAMEETEDRFATAVAAGQDPDFLELATQALGGIPTQQQVERQAAARFDIRQPPVSPRFTRLGRALTTEEIESLGPLPEGVDPTQGPGGTFASALYEQRQRALNKANEEGLVQLIMDEAEEGGETLTPEQAKEQAIREVTGRGFGLPKEEQKELTRLLVEDPAQARKKMEAMGVALPPVEPQLDVSATPEGKKAIEESVPYQRGLSAQARQDAKRIEDTRIEEERKRREQEAAQPSRTGARVA